MSHSFWKLTATDGTADDGLMTGANVHVRFPLKKIVWLLTMTSSGRRRRNREWVCLCVFSLGRISAFCCRFAEWAECFFVAGCGSHSTGWALAVCGAPRRSGKKQNTKWTAPNEATTTTTIRLSHTKEWTNERTFDRVPLRHLLLLFVPVSNGN